MKKTSPPWVAVCFVAFGGLMSCSGGYSGPPHQAVVSTPELGIASHSLESASPEPKHIVRAVDSDASLKHDFNTISDMAKSPITEAVLVGTVVKTKDLYIDGLAHRVLDVQVGDSYKKWIGKSVSVYEDGGIVPLETALPDIKDHSDVPLTAGPNDYIDMRFMGAQHTEAGDRIIAFVRSNPNNKSLIPADFQLAASLQALLVQTPNSTEYIRRGIDPKDQRTAETSIPASVVAKQLEMAVGKAVR